MEDKAPIRAIVIVTLPNGETERHEIEGTQEVTDGYTEEGFSFPPETMYGQYEYRLTVFRGDSYKVYNHTHVNHHTPDSML